MRSGSLGVGPRDVLTRFRFPWQEDAPQDEPSGGDVLDVARAASDEARAERLAQLVQSYADRGSERPASMGASPPSLPAGYDVCVQPPTSGSGGKHRIVVRTTVPAEGNTLGRSEGGGEGRGEVVGWVTCWRKKKPTSRGVGGGGGGGDRVGGSLFISSVEVKKAHRRRGVASRLLHEAEALGASEAFACEEASLTVLRNNVAAIALYERSGYAVDEGGAGPGARLFTILTDPQRILQRRMSKRLGGRSDAAADAAAQKRVAALRDGGGPGGFYDRGGR
jgi:ribosomal protein S18 acetylase RimI-like enzyme